MAASTSPQEGNAWSCKVPYHTIELQIPVQDILKIWPFVTQAVKLDDTGTEIYSRATNIFCTFYDDQFLTETH